MSSLIVYRAWCEESFPQSVTGRRHHSMASCAVTLGSRPDRDCETIQCQEEYRSGDSCNNSRKRQGAMDQDKVLKTVEPSMRAALGFLLALSVILLLCGCASDEKPKHASYRKWYQGDMDSSERSFYIDSFFDGR